RTASLDVGPGPQTARVPTRSLSVSSRPPGGLPAALARARGAFARQRDTEVVSVLRPIADRFSDSADTHELLGLAYYRLGRYTTALRHLESFYALTASLDRFPVAMDCLRALGRHRGVADLWEDLQVVSPSAEVVIEGRIVMAGSLADKGRLGEAIALLERSAIAPRRLQDHHLRQWYALADLEEQAGNLPRARALFERVARHDRQLGDVVERLSSLA
ncbi:MAG: tetratricopeptide repeat protein, partial [Acidimicrobiia bacterium]